MLTRTVATLAALLLLAPAAAQAEERETARDSSTSATTPAPTRHTPRRVRSRRKEAVPVVVFVHGGTWMIGDKNFFGLYRDAGKSLARNGVVAVMINYRLSPLVQHPEHAKRRRPRLRLGGTEHRASTAATPTAIILAGHSAGGHLVGPAGRRPDVSAETRS